MSVDKIFIKSFLNNFEEESFSVKLWDEEEIKVGQDEPLFKVTLNKPIPKNHRAGIETPFPSDNVCGTPLMGKYRQE